MDTFDYEPIDLERPAFRLLTLLKGEKPEIECTLYQAYLDGSETVPYFALSYTWGSLVKSSTVKVNGKTLGVTGNLYSALQHLRSKVSDQVFWVDAICIDQGDQKERGHQVQQMRKIYCQAERVIVWLGPATRETDILMDSLQRLEEYSQMYKHRNWDLASWTDLWLSIPRGSDGTSSKGLKLLLRRPWFKRVWILQEVANAKRASVWCGARSVRAYTFALSPPLLGIEPERHCQAVLDIMPGRLREDSWWSERRDLYNLLLKFSESEATDPRDKIYALLGISSDAPDTDSLRPDYDKDLRQVVNDTALFLFGPSNNFLQTIPELLRTISSSNAASFCKLVEASDVSKVAQFLVRRGLEVPLSDEMITAVAGNQMDGKNVLELLLHQRGKEVKVSKEVLIAAAKNQTCGKDIMRLLLEWRGSEVQFTSEVITAAAGNEISGEEVMGLLLQHCGRGVQITEEAFKAAAENELIGEKIMGILLQHCGREVKVTEAVIKAAAGNKKSGNAIVSILLGKGEEREHGTVLQQASYLGNEVVVKALLDKGANPNTQGGVYGNPLQVASYKGHELVVNALLDKGANPNTQGGIYGNALQAASLGGHELVVKALVDKGANIHMQGGIYSDALYAASYEAHKQVVEVLLDRGVNVNAQGGSYGNALQAASSKGHEAVVKLLLENGAKVNTQGGMYGNALQAASSKGHKAVVKLLLENGAKVNAQGGMYGNALQAASFEGHKAIVALLLDVGAYQHKEDDLLSKLK